MVKSELIEIRWFGSFTLRQHPPIISRNPKAGETISLGSRYTPRFKPGKVLRDRVNAARENFKIVD